MIKDLLQNKNAKEKANIKGQEIAKIDFRGEYVSQQYGVKIDIQSIKAIEGGVEIMARAWKGGKQLGFGKDGTVDIERFLIYNPPILVDDPNGDIIREWNDLDTGELKQRPLREDPAEAIRQVISHNVTLLGKEDTNIVIGKLGNTTSTFFPEAGTGSTSGDWRNGRWGASASNDTWATVVGANGDLADSISASTISDFARSSTVTNKWRGILIFHMGFDTSALPDTDNIDSAILSIKPSQIALTSVSITIVQSSPVSNTAPNNADYQNRGSVKFTSDQSVTGHSAGTYADFTLNANGIANISKTGTSNFIKTLAEDIDNTAPSWSSSGTYGWNGSYTADETGTTSDPKLVVVHSVVVTFTPTVMIF